MKSGHSEQNHTTKNTVIGVLVIVVVASFIAIGMLLLKPSGQDQDEGASNSSSSAHTNDDGGDELSDMPRRDEDDRAALGKKNAPVVMIEYADYRCPFCGAFHRDTLPTIIQKYIRQGKVRYEWRDNPIYGTQSENAAVAARAAGKQDKFWQFQDQVYSYTGNDHQDLSKKKLVGYAKKAHVHDIPQFKEDMTNPTLKKQVARDKQEAQTLGATSTPSFIIGDSVMMGAQPTEKFEEMIEKELQEQ